MRTTTDMGVRGDRKIRDMLKRKFAKVKNGEKVDIEQYPALKVDYNSTQEELQKQAEYIDRLEHTERMELKADMEEEFRNAKSDMEKQLIRKNYSRELIRRKLRPQTKEMREAKEKLEELEDKNNSLKSKLDYIRAEYSDQIKQVEAERVKAIIREAGEIE
jgi:chromosome segregation ATPase